MYAMRIGLAWLLVDVVLVFFFLIIFICLGLQCDNDNMEGDKNNGNM